MAGRLMGGATLIPASLLLVVGHQAVATTTPPSHERVVIDALPLPPTAPSDTPGACTTAINPRATGCMSAHYFALQAGSFLPDGRHVVARVTFAGASDPASPYRGEQLILVKTDGSRFANGDAWKCLSCGMTDPMPRDMSYPQSFHDGRRVLAGSTIFDCGTLALTDDRCTPTGIRAYPVHWQVSADDSGRPGMMRELRLHPDNDHIGFNAVAINDGRMDQFGYTARLHFNAPKARYDLEQVNLLFRPGIENRTLRPVPGKPGQLEINKAGIEVGEFRGFTADGREAVYVGYPWESSNIDIFAVGLADGRVRRLTSHPEYVDPVDFSPDGQWMAIEDTRGTDRQMFLAAMRGIPPITDLLSSSAVSSTRNNMDRRFFNLVLLDAQGDRGAYMGQILTDQPGVPGSAGDPNWNAMADPRWSPDSRAIVYWQALATTPACGGANPLPCPTSTEPGGRHARLMIARLPDRKASAAVKPVALPDRIGWATAYVPGMPTPKRALLPAGDYVLHGLKSGTAQVRVVQRADGKAIDSISARYQNYSDDGRSQINGGESVSEKRANPQTTQILWKSDLRQSGAVSGSKTSSPDGFALSIDVMVNKLEAAGTLSTMIDGKTYKQPANGT
ncbi:PD40 domain-containing protein [Sphingobium sp. AP49]|uniref:TolB family protein n=1 Tax=Sphingobium sp. AP49 TaxID=1144307 RepID=UPI00026EDEEA|nr:PD40 domain-containing protein [Sphingobium sp. AP49]WHO38936.1 PD40 domain-containing protein [Sphingobium sp. AP49]